MVIDFGAVRAHRTTLAALVADLSVEDLAAATGRSIDQIEEFLAGATDEDVNFVPEDPEAHDSAASDPSEEAIAWTLGHLVVHVTASSEESAAMAAEMARGVPSHGRSRWEVPWQTMTSIAACRHRLAESRRMRLASLNMWPDSPPSQIAPNDEMPSWKQAKERFARGLQHEESHFDQFRDVASQARAARGSA